MRFINRIIAALAMLAVVSGLTTFAAHATEPVVSEPTYSQSTFEAADHVTTTTKLKSTNKGNVYLNVQAQPMTGDQIQPGSCVTKPVGTWFWNEIVDPVTGERKFDHRQVQANDRVFCKDRSGVLRKKSCGNEARFNNPPPKRLRVKGKVNVVDYLMWVAEQTQKITKTGSALASVKTETCEARATVDNTVSIFQRYRARVKSRTMLEAQAEGARKITIKAENDQKVEGKLRTDIKIGIYGKATALCTTPPPEHDECPDIPGNQPPGYMCETPQPPEKPTWMQFREFNDLEVNWKDDHCVTVNFPSGTGTVTWDANLGSFATPTLPAKSGEQVCNEYTAPSEPGSDQISAMAKDDKLGTTIGPRQTLPFRVDPPVTHPN